MSTRIEQLKTFLENEPDDPFLNYALAMEYKNTDKAMATRQLEELLKKHPTYGATYYHLASLYLENSEKDKAIETYKAGIAVTTKNREQHLLAELQSALNNLLYDD